MSLWVLIFLTFVVKSVSGGIPMKLREYINNLAPQELAAYAKRCRIALSYLRLHVKYASKDPSVSLLRSLTRESNGCVSLAEVLEHFDITEESVERKAA
jgi:hypothetical protein